LCALPDTRVMVSQIDDIQAQVIARDIATQVRRN
jgi:hypothetical protein